jgi:hypothetical protein
VPRGRPPRRLRVTSPSPCRCCLFRWF